MAKKIISTSPKKAPTLSNQPIRPAKPLGTAPITSMSQKSHSNIQSPNWKSDPSHVEGGS